MKRIILIGVFICLIQGMTGCTKITNLLDTSTEQTDTDNIADDIVLDIQGNTDYDNIGKSEDPFPHDDIISRERIMIEHIDYNIEISEVEINEGVMNLLPSYSLIVLDMNGNKVKVYFDVDYENDNYKININSQYAIGHGVNLTGDLYAIRLLGDKTVFLIPEDGPSADEAMYTYLYDNGNLSYSGLIPGWPNVTKVYDDYFSSIGTIDTFGSTCWLSFDYELIDGIFERRHKDFYEWDYAVTALRDFELYSSQNIEDTGFSVKEGSELTILGFDLEGWAHIKENATGKSGWLYYERGYLSDSDEDYEVEYCILPDGTKIKPSDLMYYLSYSG